MKIETLDACALKQASLRLYDIVVASNYIPTHIVAIATGGVFVAQPIVEQVGADAIYIEVSVQRPSTAGKSKLNIKRFLKSLPYVVTDQLRRAEALWLSLRSEREKGSGELPESCRATLDAIARKPETRVLVIDDAVDSGRTLASVLGALRPVPEAGGEVRSAVLTVTRKKPQVWPDFSLFDRVLCRFPWSYDFKA